jgi:hypothetical protein
MTMCGLTGVGKTALALVSAVVVLGCDAAETQPAHLNSPRSQEARVDAREGATIAGLTGIFVVLDGVSPDVEALGLRQPELLLDIQNQLRAGRVRVLAREEARRSPGSPLLVHQSQCRARRSGLCIFHPG